MCGICGIVETGGGKARADEIRAMCAQLHHRGPDDSGVRVDPKGGAGLGHARLSIIDLSKAGHEPMCNEDGSVWLTFNGEIYNFMELRKPLEAAGHVFRSNTDAEVIIHLYEEDPAGFVAKLSGMFALAIWDEKRKRLCFARDRLGKKPFYYFHEAGRFAFASELSALMKAGGAPRETDWTSVGMYFKYMFIPSPATIYRKVRKLKPGHVGVLEDGKLKIRRFWEAPPPSDARLSEAEHAERLAETVRTAVKRRLVSDVPLGAFLSGGLDSSVIVAAMSGLAGGRVKTFTIGFKDESYDERKYAARVARELGTEHEELVVEYDIKALMPEMARHFGEPFGDSSAIPTWYLSKMTRRSVTVALSGDGGDEIFCGYRRYMGRKLLNYYRALPASARDRIIRPLVRMLPEGAGYYGKSIVKQAKLFVNQARRMDEDRISVLPHTFELSEIDELLADGVGRPGPLAADPVREFSEKYSRLDHISHMMWTDMNTYLPDDILVKVDRMSMAHALEVRSPFLDEEVIKVASEMPISMKLKGLETKHILKKAFAHVLPKGIAGRPKQGFMVPLAAWFKHELKDYSEEILMDGGHDYFNHAYLRRLLDEHRRGREDHSQKIWLIMTFNQWHDQHKWRTISKSSTA